ncbi:MAG: hypothetical protein R3A80_10665 [Bdellovibrionota bacterium]
MSLRGSKLGQGTLEYILLTTLVVGIVLTIFNGPLKRFLASYTSRKTEYTNVVAQRNMGIPLKWFGGDFKNPDASAGGGATTGGATAGDGSEDPSSGAPDAVNGPNDPQAPGASDPDGNSPEGGSPPGRGGGANGPGSNNSLLSPGSSGSNSNNRGSTRTRTSGRERDDGEADGSSGTITGGRGSGVQGPGEGSLGEDPPANETEEEKETRIKKKESGDTLRQERELFGSNTRRVREGSCGNLDLKVILQIAFVLGLLFMLASLLFQKRGDD